MLWAHLALSHHPQAKVLVGTDLGTCPSQEGFPKRKDFYPRILQEPPQELDTASITLNCGRAGTELWAELPSTGSFSGASQGRETKPSCAALISLSLGDPLSTGCGDCPELSTDTLIPEFSLLTHLGQASRCVSFPWIIPKIH